MFLIGHKYHILLSGFVTIKTNFPDTLVGSFVCYICDIVFVIAGESAEVLVSMKESMLTEP